MESFPLKERPFRLNASSICMLRRTDFDFGELAGQFQWLHRLGFLALVSSKYCRLGWTVDRPNRREREKCKLLQSFASSQCRDQQPVAILLSLRVAG